MSEPHPPKNAVLIAGILYNDRVRYADLREALISDFGDLYAESDHYSFHESSYYADEMGETLTRVYVAWGKTVAQDTLPEIKHKACAREALFAQHGKRNVNIDPGLLTPHNLILASCKDFTQRIYLRDGIYAEMTLMVKKGMLCPLPWTYPDYAAPRTRLFFNEIRRAFIATHRKPRTKPPKKERDNPHTFIE